MNDNSQATLLGAATTLLGCLIMMLWDRIKYWDERKNRDDALKRLLSEELNSGILIMVENHRLLREELDEKFANKQMSIKPLRLLPTSAWDLFRVNLPREFEKDTTLLIQIRNVALVAQEINETIRSRENYRIACQPYKSFLMGMSQYNEIIIIGGVQYAKAVQKLAPKLQISLPEITITTS